MTVQNISVGGSLDSLYTTGTGTVERHKHTHTSHNNCLSQIGEQQRKYLWTWVGIVIGIMKMVNSNKNISMAWKTWR